MSVIRILSDLHYGDRASQVRNLAQLNPLREGISQLVLNGDTLDTRLGPRPDFTARLRAELRTWIETGGIETTLLTGNHDPDVSTDHSLDLAGGRVFATHGDIIFDNIVPWGRDAALITRLLATELALLAPPARVHLESRLELWRKVSGQIPQRHQSEPHGAKYALHFMADTVWPPLRIFRILRAWQQAPNLAATIARLHRPLAKFVLIGHTHRPGVWRARSGVVVINTGSFCPPVGGCAVDLSPDRLAVRRVEKRRGEFHVGKSMAEFTLADVPTSPTLHR